ncbi:MAG: lipid-A-disaccharide synthase [Bacteroidales bacterium]|nr:lipid-A-disaccharide synthase [Bacteroidales bacterium]
MKYFLIAGEASGDLHASNLMKGLQEADSGAEFRYMGGDLMRGVSDGMVMHYRETSYMMLDVLFHLGKIFRNMRKLKRTILQWQPDVLIPVDYPGFNMRMSRFAYTHGIKVFYYISPKVWAWNQKRVIKLNLFTHRIFAILPFEVEFFRRFGMEVEYFGNPLVDQVTGFREKFEGEAAWKKRHGLDEKPLVALLSGSRVKEIETTLPPMIRLAEEQSGYQFVVAGAPSLDRGVYERYLSGTDIKIVYGETYALLESATAGVINSGTATLEAALFELPQVVLYRTSRLAYAIAKRLIKVKFISLVNLIYGSRLVEEIIQKNMLELTRKELARILDDEPYRKGMQQGYRELIASLGEPGVFRRIGRRMIELLKGDIE